MQAHLGNAFADGIAVAEVAIPGSINTTGDATLDAHVEALQPCGEPV
jgi:hypothetical protein